jgi:hypothetical protein
MKLAALRDSQTLPPELAAPMLKGAEERLRMLTAMVKTTQTKSRSKLSTQN